MGVSENRLNPIVPNGFADHYPYNKWLFHWEYTLSVLIDAEPVVSTSCEAGGIKDRFPETATALDGRWGRPSRVAVDQIR